MNSKMKILLSLCLLVGLLFATYRHFFDDLNMNNITEKIPFQPEWEIQPLDQTQQAQLNQILQQNFTFIGEGGQSYVFESADQHYVLKLFKFKRFRPSLFINLIPDKWFDNYKERHIQRKQQKLFSAFDGHKLAYDKLKKESGLVYIQLNPSNSPTLLKLTDRFGLSRTIDLGQTAYVLQVKGETLEENFTRLLKEGRPDLVHDHMQKVLQLYVEEYQKGLYDMDHGVMHNIGFVGDTPLHLDVGKLVADDKMKSPENYQPDLTKVSEKMNAWLKKHTPKQSLS